MPSRTELQLDLLARMASLDAPPFIIGGYAEDSLIDGRVTREHEDVDWIVPRSELPLRLEQARQLGFTEFETWGESAPGEPFYIYAPQGELTIDIGVCNEFDGAPVIDVGRLMFQVDGREAPGGFRVHLPADTFHHEPVMINGVRVWPASPLALYQLRIGIASQGAFGELDAKQRTSLRRLRAAFFSDWSDEDLAPQITPLPPA